MLNAYFFKYRKEKLHIVEIYLNYVGIRYTKKYFKELLLNYPDSDTFTSFRYVLSDYKIDSRGFRLSISDLHKISDPVITQINNDNTEFIVLIGNTKSEYSYISESGKIEMIDSAQFEKKWTGIILFPEVAEESQEKNYYRNVIFEFIT